MKNRTKSGFSGRDRRLAAAAGEDRGGSNPESGMDELFVAAWSWEMKGFWGHWRHAGKSSGD